MRFKDNYIAKSLGVMKDIPDDETGDRFVGQTTGKHALGYNIATIWWTGRHGVMECAFEIDTAFDNSFLINILVKDGIVYLYKYDWTHYFKKIFLINLPERTEKLKAASDELTQHSIPFEIFPAIKHANGKYGIFLTMQKIFSECVGKFDRILCFEDDVLFVRDPQPIMDECVMQLQNIEWDLFYMGPNTHQRFTGLFKDNLLPLQEAFARHATAYSDTGMRKILDLGWRGNSLDIEIRGQIQPHGKCYCSWPFLATQRPGYSDIENKYVTQDYIEQRFNTHTKHLPPYGHS